MIVLVYTALGHQLVYWYAQVLTHCMILSRSSGLTTVREAAPAIPPAMKYDDNCGLSQGSLGFVSTTGGCTTSTAGDVAEDVAVDVMVELS